MEILVKNRSVLGKKVKSLRKEGLVPAEIYGRGLPNRHVQISEKDFRKVFKSAGEHTLLNAITENGEKIPVLINHIDRNAISGQLLSVDFHAVRLDEKTRSKIPIELTGTAPATKNGFVVVRVYEEIEVEALPDKLPNKIEIDISALETPGQSIHTSDLKLSADVKILATHDAVLVTVKEKAKEEEVAAPVVSTEPTATTTTETPKEGAAPETPKA